MAVKSAMYVPQLSQDTYRGPSPAIWSQLVVEDFLQDPSLGMHFFDDFLMTGQFFSGTGGQTGSAAAAVSVGQWSAWGDQYAQLATDPDLEGGVIQLSSSNAGSEVTATGMTLISNAGGFGFISPASGYPLGQKLLFECRVAVGSITTAKRDCFIGLCDNTSPASQATNLIIASTTNTLATTNGLIGFHFRSTTNPTDVGLAFNVAAGTVQYPTNLQTLSTTVVGSALAAYSDTNNVAKGFVKLGFVFDPTAGNVSKIITSASSGQTAGNLAKPMLQVFVNGQAAPAFLTATNIQAATFPSNWMAPAISYKTRSATAPGDFYVDWIRVAQLANT